MTLDEFVAQWRRYVREYGSGVPQEAIDMAEQAWETATTTEREACAKLVEQYGHSLVDGSVMAERIRARSNDLA